MLRLPGRARKYLQPEHLRARKLAGGEGAVLAAHGHVEGSLKPGAAADDSEREGQHERDGEHIAEQGCRRLCGHLGRVVGGLDRTGRLLAVWAAFAKFGKSCPGYSPEEAPSF